MFDTVFVSVCKVAVIVTCKLLVILVVELAKPPPEPPEPLVIDTSVVSLVVQVTRLVTSVPSCAVAVNCLLVPCLILAEVGEMVMDVMPEGTTVTVPVPEIP